MRLFVAVPVPARVRERLVAAVEPGHDDGLRWTDPSGWHITLAFLGTVPDPRLDEVAEVVRASVGAVGPPETLALGAAGRFGQRVLWVAVTDEPDGSLARVGAAIQDGLDRASLPVERRDVRGHLTLARASERRVTEAWVRAIQVPTATWPCRSIEVWSSSLGRGGARYTCEVSVAVDTA